MKKEILELVESEFSDVDLNENLKELIALFIDDIMRHENVSLEDITKAGKGKTSVNLKIGEYVLKVGRSRRTKNFKNSSRILQPVIRREIEDETGEKMFIEVQNLVDTKWIHTEKYNVAEIMYKVYKDIRDAGMIWTDIRYTNIGRLLKDNKVNYDIKVHDGLGNEIYKEIEPMEAATGLNGKNEKVLKKGDYVLIDTDFVFDENNLPDGKRVKDVLLRNLL